MIVVKIELHSAVTGKVTKLGEMTITNDGMSHSVHFGHYDACIMRKPKFTTVTRQARIRYWPRRSRTVWQLVREALVQLYPDKKGREDAAR